MAKILCTHQNYYSGNPVKIWIYWLLKTKAIKTWRIAVRCFFVDKRYFVIVDEAKGTDTGDIDIHFQLAVGDAIFNHESFSVHSNFSEGWNVFVQTQKQKGLELIEEKGQVSFEYTKKEPRPAFCFRIKKEKENANVRFVTIVVPYQGKQPNINVEVIENKEPGSSKLQLEINEDNVKKVIEYAL